MAMRPMLSAVVAALALAACDRPSPAEPTAEQPAAASATAPVSLAAIPDIAEGTPYAQARTVLIGQGFAPVKQARTGSELFCGRVDDEADLCLLYPEVEDCAGTGVRPCLFVFERIADRRRLEVATYGELTSHVRVKRVAWGGEM